jgi:hypothetical protein
MSDLNISIILYAITAVAGLICGFLESYIFVPMLPGALIGAVAGYFGEKHQFKKMYDEPYIFRLERLSFWGIIGGTFLSLVAFQAVIWIVE